MYLNKENRKRAEQILSESLSNFPNIFANGSVQGMINRYGWQRGGTVTSGGYTYRIKKFNVDKIKHLTT